MIELKNNEIKKIYAGGMMNAGIYAAITAGISFIIGVIDGITRPFKCR
ncbi:MAG: hypothetical protein IIZ40_03755 [Bacilli bacterium]|nr:hypothetical protein [Bacilli bacterium]